MIGLCKMAAFETYRQIRPTSAHWVNEYVCFGMISRAIMHEYTQKQVGEWFPSSRYYYQLLDACPLRMSGANTLGIWLAIRSKPFEPPWELSL